LRSQGHVSAPREVALAPGERRVLQAFAAGKSDTTIAAELGRSVNTIRTVARTIRAKFDAHRMDDVIVGLRTGLYAVRKSEDRYNLTSALQLLHEGLGTMRRAAAHRPKPNRRQTLRLHELEIEALLHAGRAFLAGINESDFDHGPDTALRDEP
jgi:DNA-binding CsgD family transcriptional regulator